MNENKTTMTPEEQSTAMNFLWDSLLGENNCASYDGLVDLDVLNIIQCIAESENKFYDDISTKLNIPMTYVQLVQYLLCSTPTELADYGTSPRGCWLTTEGEAFYEKLRKYHNY